MWTARNVSRVLENLQAEVDRLLTTTSHKANSMDEKSAGVHEFDDGLIRRFCELELDENRIDSPCFRLGSGQLKLHHHYVVHGGGGGGTAQPKPAIRSVKRGKFITCYATCCNRGLSEGCHVCDRLSDCTHQHHGEREVHFVNTTERPPIVIHLSLIHI